MKKTLLLLTFWWAGAVSLLCQPAHLQQALTEARQNGDTIAQAEALLALTDFHIQQKADSLALLYATQGLALDISAAPELLGQLRTYPLG